MKTIFALTAQLVTSLAALHAANQNKPASDGPSPDMWGKAYSAKTNLVRGAWLKDSPNSPSR